MSARNAKLLLAAVFAARGTSFLFSKTLLRDLSPMSILAVRFTLSFLILAFIFIRKLQHISKADLKGGVILGILYTAGMIMEMYGLRTVDTGVSALIENMAIVLVPIYAAILTRVPPEKKTMLCAGLAVIGVGFLSVTQWETPGSGTGLLLIILTAMNYAVCIMATEKVSRNADPLNIGIIQLGIMGFASLMISLLLEDFALPRTGLQWTMLLLLVLLCSCFGFTFQPVGQKYLPAETAAVFTVINPLTASIMGITIAGETFSPAKIIGYILILGALFLYNLQEKPAAERPEIKASRKGKI